MKTKKNFVPALEYLRNEHSRLNLSNCELWRQLALQFVWRLWYQTQFFFVSLITANFCTEKNMKTFVKGLEKLLYDKFFLMENSLCFAKNFFSLLHCKLCTFLYRFRFFLCERKNFCSSQVYIVKISVNFSRDFSRRKTSRFFMCLQYCHQNKNFRVS